MIGKKNITNEPAIAVLEDGLGGEFLSFDEYNYSKQDVKDSSFLVHRLKIICPHCGWDNKKSPDTSYDCVSCMRKFQDGEIKDEGFKINTTEVEQFVDGYKLRIDELPHQFYERDRLEHDKYLIFTRGTGGNFEALDSGAEVTILPLSYLERFAYDEDEIDNIIEVLKQRRSERIDFSLANGKQFQSMNYRLGLRLARFEPYAEGGYNQDQGKDGILKLAGHSDQKVMIQSKKEDSINNTDILQMVADANQHDCKWLVVAVLDVTGDAMTKFNSNNYVNSSNLNNVEIWKEEDIREMLNHNLDLVKEYGLLPRLNSN